MYPLLKAISHSMDLDKKDISFVDKIKIEKVLEKTRKMIPNASREEIYTILRERRGSTPRQLQNFDFDSTKTVTKGGKKTIKRKVMKTIKSKAKKTIKRKVLKKKK